MHIPCLAMVQVTWIIWTVVFNVIPEGGLVLLGVVDTGDCCCWCTGEFRGSAAFMVFPPVVCIILLPLCDLVKGGGMTADVPGTYCLLFGAELDRGLSISWMKSLGGPVRQGAEPLTLKDTITNYPFLISPRSDKTWVTFRKFYFPANIVIP